MKHTKNSAKYYIYRNLTKNCFSVKHRGKVIAHYDTIDANGVTFKVNEKSRQRVIKEKKKYVHAYVVCDSLQGFNTAMFDLPITVLNKAYIECKYNPYTQGTFTADKQVISHSKYAYLQHNKVFVNTHRINNSF